MSTTKLLSRILVLSIFSLIVITTGCKKDDDEEKKNEATYKNNTEAITKAKVIEIETGNFLLGLSSQECDFDFSEGYVIPEGNGTILIFQLIGNNSGELVSGTYYFSVSSNVIAMTIVNSAIYFDFNFSSGTGTQTFISSGKVTMTLNNSKAEIQIDASDTSGEKITGYYNGLVVFDDAQ